MNDIVNCTSSMSTSFEYINLVCVEEHEYDFEHKN